MVSVLLALSLVGTQPASPPPLHITHVNVIDCKSDGVKADENVLVIDGRIQAIAKHLKSSAQVVDGRGKYLIPGLWDMHVHGTSVPGFLNIYLANGVTGIRDMFDPSGATFKLRDQIKSGKLLGPHIIAAGKIVDGPKPIWPGSVAVATPEDGRKAVETILKEGSDFVKVYSLLSKESYLAIADECHKRNVVFGGHVPEGVSAEEASNAGQKSFEHLYSILPGCAAHPETTDGYRMIGVPREQQRKALRAMLDYDPVRAGKLFAALKRNGSWQCPTLTVLNSVNHPLAKRPETERYMPYLPSWMKMIRGTFAARAKDWTQEDIDLHDQAFQKDLEVVSAMYRAGVPIIAGTDVMNPYCFPGFSLHDELGWLVKAGLPTIGALRCSTLNAARYLGIEKDYGTVQKGKVADLVLLDANPLADIQNTRRISAVIVGGKLLDRAALDKMMPKQTKVSAMPKHIPVGAFDEDY